MAYPVYPQDPRFGIPIQLNDDHVKRLCSGRMLHQTVIDYLIQRASPIPHKPMGRFGFIVCASTGAMNSMILLNREFSSLYSSKKFVPKKKEKMKGFRAGKYTIVVPHVSRKHFFVLSITLNGEEPNLYEMVNIYDSLVTPSGDGGIRFHSEATDFLRVFNDYWHNFVLHDATNDTRAARESIVLQIAKIRASPQQPKDSLNCGLFTVGVSLHLLEGFSVNSTTFDGDTIANMRTSLSSLLSNRGENQSDTPDPMKYLCNTSIRNFFQKLPVLESQSADGKSLFFHYQSTINQDHSASSDDDEVIHVEGLRKSSPVLADNQEYIASSDDDEVIRVEGLRKSSPVRAHSTIPASISVPIGPVEFNVCKESGKANLTFKENDYDDNDSLFPENGDGHESNNFKQLTERDLLSVKDHHNKPNVDDNNSIKPKTTSNNHNKPNMDDNNITEPNTMSGNINVDGDMDDNNITRSNTMLTCVTSELAGIINVDENMDDNNITKSKAASVINVDGNMDDNNITKSKAASIINVDGNAASVINVDGNMDDNNITKSKAASSVGGFTENTTFFV